MADNYETTPGSGGKVFASDEIQGTGVHVPRVKAQFGIDGQAVDVSALNPLPVVMSNSPTEAGQTAANTALEAIAAALAPLAVIAQQSTVGTALQPGPLPVGTTLPVAQLSDATAAGRALVTAADVTAQRTALGLGTAATRPVGDFATAAQGAAAETALQPGALPAGTMLPLAQVTGAGTAAGQPTTAFATAAQGAKADSALQPGALPAGTTLPLAQVTGAGTAAGQPTTAFATAAQGAKADSALQPGALPAGTTLPLAQVTGAGTAAGQPTTAFATAAQGAKADSALQPGALPAGTTLPLAQVTGVGTAAGQPTTAFATAVQGAKADSAMPGTMIGLQAVIDGGTPAEKAALSSSVSGAANRLTRRQRLLSRPWAIAQMIPSALGGTITGTPDMSDGAYAGGEIITMTQTTTAGPRNTIETRERLYVPAIGNDDAWFATFEIRVDAGQFVLVGARNEASTDLFTIQIGLPDNKLTFKCPGGTDIVVTPAAFTQAQWCRITAVVTPTTAITGTIRYFAYWTSTATNTETRQYLGSQTYTSNVIPTRMVFTQSWIATGVVQFARLVVAETYIITNGCSLDAGYVGWCPSPYTARTFAPNGYNYLRNPAYLFGQLLFGDGDWPLNHARGGHTVADMSSEFQAFVLDLSPRLISIGSASNSINNAVGLGTDPATTAQLEIDKALYLAMCQQAIATGAIVIATAVAPRHDTVAIANLPRWKSYALAWNAWMETALLPIGVRIARTWDVLEDPALPGRLVGWANAGDAVHYSWKGQRKISELQFGAVMGTT